MGTPGTGGIWAPMALKLLDIAIPKNASQRAGWTSDEKRSALNRTYRSMSRQ